jgi:hypothetical protein
MKPTEALSYIQQALTDYANSMAPSPRAAFIRMTNEALSALLPSSQQPMPASEVSSGPTN